jgi:DNA-binding CsgD family transcriptional regulator
MTKHQRELLERELELELLESAIEGDGVGRASVTLLEGGPGLGKSSLLDRADELAGERGFAVLRARAGVLERTLAWGVARQLFESFVVRAPVAARRSLLSGAASLAGPLLGLRPGRQDDPTQISDVDCEHGLYWLARNLAQRQPLALLIDDAQWSDQTSLRWLLYLIRRIERLPVAIIVSARPCDPDAPTGLLDALGAERVATVCALAPLSDRATQTALERAYEAPVDRRFAEACHSWTAGNPMFVTELAAKLAAEGVEPVAAAVDRVRTIVPPPAIARPLLLALARLSAPAVELARAVAVLEPAAELRHAAALAGLDLAAATDAFDELVRAHVLESDQPLTFVHPVLGRVVRDDQLPARRASAHRSAAQLLAGEGVDSELVVHHLLRSAPAGDEWAVDQLTTIAGRELERGAPGAAVTLLRRALEEPPPAARSALVRLALGRAEALAGDRRALQTLATAFAGTREPSLRAEIALLLGQLRLRAGDPGEAVEVLRAEADALGWLDPELRLRLEAMLMAAARFAGGSPALISDRQALVRSHEAESAPAARLVAGQQSWTLAASGTSARRANELARRALAEGEEIEEAPDAPEAWLGPIHVLALGDELEGAERWWAAAFARAERAGSVPAIAAVSCYRSATARLRGRVVEAELHARDALRACDSSLALLRGIASAGLAQALLDRGAAQEAVIVLERDLARLEQLPGAWAAETMFAAGRALVADGRLRGGAELLLGAGRRALEFGLANPAWLAWRSEAALALLALGDDPGARRLSDEELDLARRFGARRPIGIALRACGLIEGGDGGASKLEQSVGVLAASEARLEYARSLIELGCALRRGKRRADSRGPLKEGLAISHECGARALVERARAELAAAGARPRNAFRTGTDALTPSERRVCDLAASGKTNPQIARSLFVSRGTVESHLHSAYRKLEIDSRAALPVVLAA